MSSENAVDTDTEHGPIFRAKQWSYRFLKYLWRRPEPLSDPTLGGKTVLVLGSAPGATPPEGLDRGFRLVTVNGSQQIAEKWGHPKPDITIMQFNQIEGTNVNAREVRRVLNGRETGTLYVMLWRQGRASLERGLKAFDYRCDELQIIDRYQRVALVRRVSGILNFELDASTKYSNGIIAVLLALNSGAKSVVLCGINPLSSGHAYNDEGLQRKHAQPDLAMIRLLLKRSYPVFTSDASVAAGTGLPLWRPSDGQPAAYERPALPSAP